MVKHCPITNGLPTKMPEATFRALCNLRRKQNGSDWGCGGGGEKRPTYCSEVCRGEVKPKELKYLSNREVMKWKRA